MAITSPNPPNGSWGMFKDPTYTSGWRLRPRIPPTAVGGCLRSNLHERLAITSPNPPNGKWGKVNIQTSQAAPPFLPESPQRTLEEGRVGNETRVQPPRIPQRLS